MKLVCTLVLAIAAVCAMSTAAAAAPDTAAKAPVATPVATPAKAPAMWLIKDADSKIYLFGTIHALPEGVEWKTPKLEEAMQESQITAVETDTESAFARSTMAGMLLEHGLNPSWQTLRSILGAERYSKLAAVAKKYDVNMKEMSRLRPWLAMMTISAHVASKAGLQGKLGVDRKIIAMARKQKDKILMMETPEAQMKALATMDGPDVLDNFDVALGDITDFDAKFQPMLTAWRTGDVEGLDKTSSAPMRKSAPVAYAALLTNRNARWVPRIERWLGGKGNYFIAVGAAHLAGPDSVIAMLAKKGIKAERVQ
jgi:hypothetical protein